MKKILLVVITNILIAANAFSASVPNTFTNGTTADASEVNENFTALADAITALENLLASATPSDDLTGTTYCGVHMFNHVGVFTNGGSTSAGNGFDSIMFANSTEGSWNSSTSDFFTLAFSENDDNTLATTLGSDSHSASIPFTYTVAANKLILSAVGDVSDSIEFFISADSNTIVGLTRIESVSESNGENKEFTIMIGVRAANCN